MCEYQSKIDLRKLTKMKVKLSHLVCLEESKENESQLSAAILREITHLIHNLYIFF